MPPESRLDWARSASAFARLAPRQTRLAWVGVKDLVGYVVYEAPIEGLELWTTLNALLWGAWLLVPWFDVFGSGFYGWMATVMHESLWGAIACTAATIQLMGRITGRLVLIRIGARTLAGLWMFAGTFIAMGDWRLASIVTYSMMSAASMLVSYRAQLIAVRLRPVEAHSHGDGS